MAERKSLKLTADEVKGFSLRPEGRYTVEVATVKETKGKNAPHYEMYEIEYNVIDGPEGAPKGKIRDWVLLEEYTSALVQLSKATGFTVTEDFEIPLPDEFEGKELVVEIVHEERKQKNAQGVKEPVLDEDGEPIINASIKRRISLEAAAKAGSAVGSRPKARVRKI